jgi:large subunit ribosomal protein L11
MLKKIKTILKIVLVAGKATPAPPIGPLLGQHGVNITMFCKEYNLKTIEFIGLIIPVKITIYEDRSYSFILKSAPTSNLLLQKINLQKGSAKPNQTIIGTLTKDQIIEIAKIKIKDFNTNSLDKAILIIKGTAKNMGITFTD